MQLKIKMPLLKARQTLTVGIGELMNSFNCYKILNDCNRLN